jgi:membrane associated rhomboid family serine protease
VTLAVVLCTLAVSVAGLMSPAVLAALQRRPGELADGQLWRLLSSLLVHNSWIALVGNLIALAIIGTAAERTLRPGVWVTLYLLGGITGQLVGLAWQPTGAGNSVAVLGLLAGLTVLALLGRAVPVVALAFGVVWLLALVAGHLDSTPALAFAAGASAIAGVLIVRLRTRHDAASVPSRPLAAAVLVAGLALLALHDIHGPALLVPTAVAAAVWHRLPTATP